MPNAGCIISNQITQMINSGLWDASSEIHFGINGGDESKPVAAAVIPAKARVTFHGLASKAENLTVEMVLNWAKTNPVWNILYLHGKGASHPPDSEYYRNVSVPWRLGMMHDLVTNWRQCVNDLDYHDIVCSHWLWGQCDGTQHIPEGNFLWTTSNFVARLPSMYERQRIKDSGIGALESRYESEVFWGNGPRPKVKQYRLRSYTGAQSRL